ncbi:hypothetical protein ABZT06_01065 [Streptomyces sp. NPDC005483]|uniref:hypothetical protein n=1 Tax=Streptomyces sp. NPDC005483 TaxID=3154882 RepID=UPI0033A74D5B
MVRSRLERVSGEQVSRDAAGSAERHRTTDTQVWNWAENAALSGCGPSARDFL